MLKKITEEYKKLKNGSEFNNKNNEFVKELKNDINKINILPDIEMDNKMKQEYQNNFIFAKDKNEKLPGSGIIGQSSDPDYVVNRLRLIQLEDAFRDGFKHVV